MLKQILRQASPSDRRKTDSSQAYRVKPGSFGALAFLFVGV
jgi:hypothetical protein